MALVKSIFFFCYLGVLLCFVAFQYIFYWKQPFMEWFIVTSGPIFLLNIDWKTLKEFIQPSTSLKCVDIKLYYGACSTNDIKLYKSIMFLFEIPYLQIEGRKITSINVKTCQIVCIYHSMLISLFKIKLMLAHRRIPTGRDINIFLCLCHGWSRLLLIKRRDHP